MAEIRPFRAWRYKENAGNIEELVSPLSNADDAEIKKYYSHPLNSIHLWNYENAASAKNILEEWKTKKIIVQDTLPSIYIYYQYFIHPDTGNKVCQKGFISNVRIHNWEEQIILRHENVMPHSVSTHLKILEDSQFNLSPTHGLYTDANLELEPYMDKAIENSIYDFTDHNGITHKMAAIYNEAIVEKFSKTLSKKPVILADGHHRYTASLKYREKLLKAGRNVFAANYHCMLLTNTESSQYKIYPRHRLICELQGMDEEQFINKLNDFFTVDFIEDPLNIKESISGTKHCFGVLFRDQNMIVKLKEGILKDLNWKFPDEIKDLDLTVMHYFIIEKILGIPGKDHKNSKNIDFSFNFTKAVSQVKNGSVKIALITREISMEEIKRICYSGFTFPHKSTFFYPKPVAGLLFQSIAEEEFLKEKQLYQKERSL
ncbi:MAG: DUF1015 domain-containing protein [Cytophagaceae bacterium]|nr:DUF1015 domain-containing protein [Cytophagaceae bacterium]